jgi:hypothetical protein
MTGTFPRFQSSRFVIHFHSQTMGLPGKLRFSLALFSTCEESLKCGAFAR